jgi:DNA repair protein RadA/Sms
VLVTLEGTRPMLVEIQALVDSAASARGACRWAWSATAWPCCWRCCTATAAWPGDQDVFVNAVGGVRISEPAADLAVLLAITGSLRGKPLPKGFIAFGEVGLAGGRAPPRGQERLREAAKLGFSVAVVPKANAPRKADRALEASRSTPSSAWTRPSRWCVGLNPRAIRHRTAAVQSCEKQRERAE